MLVIGTFEWPKTLETGEFYCTICDGPSMFRRRTSRPFLTIYFVPLIPIGGKQEYVECMKCKHRFEPSILSDSKAANSEVFSDDLLRIIVLVILEDNQISDEEIQRAIDVQRVIGQSQLTREVLATACAKAGNNPMTLASYLWSGCRRWNRDNKISIVQAMFLVAGAEGEISTRRLAALSKAQQILQLTTHEFENCIVEAEQIKF
jgi:zinc-ribbon family/Tellurite resistance protein TerB